jgi:tetratricopeptide (TPR) repeat protein
MNLKDQLLQILENGRATELAFLASLTEADRAKKGTFEKWSAKDVIAHANYWQDVRATRARAWIDREELEPLPHYEQANVHVFDRYKKNTWEEIEAFAKQTHEKMVQLVAALDDDALNGPSEESDAQKVWQTIIGSSYTHKLMHYAEFYHDRGQYEVPSRLWGEWADLVSPLDDSADWQGGVHYNAACSLALAGNQQGALEELRKGLELRPNLRAWSRRDTDLANLHDLPVYKELIAPDFWWKAFEAGPQAEALTDQFVRALSMFRIAVDTCPQDEWRQGSAPHQRPAGLALHIVQSINYYSTHKPGDQVEDALTQMNWQERDADKLPSQEELLRFLSEVEKRTASLIASSDLAAKEELFPWTGFTILSRVLFMLRHAQHHIADLITEINRHTGRSVDLFQ